MATSKIIVRRINEYFSVRGIGMVVEHLRGSCIWAVENVRPSGKACQWLSWTNFVPLSALLFAEFFYHKTDYCSANSAQDNNRGISLGNHGIGQAQEYA